MKHRPICKQTALYLAIQQLFDPGMSVILDDPCISCAHSIFGTFQHLKVDIMPTNQRAGHAIPLIAVSGIEQNSCQCRLIEPKGL